MNEVQRVLYRLPALQKQKLVFIVEGEKDADKLAGLGLTATTNAGGAGKWRDSYAQQLTAAGVQRVIVIPDHDEPGIGHARVVAATLNAGDSADYPLGAARRAYLVPAKGEVEVNGVRLNARDGAAIAQEDVVTVKALSDAEIVLVDAA